MSGHTPAEPTSEDGRARPARAAAQGTTRDPAGDAAPRSPARGRSWLAPAATFVVGLLLGLLLAAVLPGRDQGADVAEPTALEPAATPTATPAPGPDATVTVPAACLQVAGTAEQVAGLVRDAAEAAGELDAAALSAMVRQLGELEAELEAQSGECRAAGSP